MGPPIVRPRGQGLGSALETRTFWVDWGHLMDSKSARDSADAILAAWNRRDYDKVAGQLASDVVLVDHTRGRTATGPHQYVDRFRRILIQCERVFKEFRSGFLGKCSPVHFFWGSFDLAVTRFSGRRAPRHPGGVPHLSDAVACEAYSHEESSAGFWPGSGAIDYPAFYSYAYPEPEGYRATPVQPAAAFFSEALGEFILPYDAVRTAAAPDQALLEFLQSTYDAAADTAKWDRDALECTPGQPGVVRQV